MQDLKEEAIAIIQTSKLLSQGDQKLFDLHVDYFIKNSNYASIILKQEIARIQALNMY